MTAITSIAAISIISCVYVRVFGIKYLFRQRRRPFFYELSDRLLSLRTFIVHGFSGDVKELVV